MGTDIHVLIQCRDRRGEWYTRHDLTGRRETELESAARDRNYWLFHLLAGIRGGPFTEAHHVLGLEGKLRGVPEELADRENALMCGYHSTSFFTCAELERYPWTLGIPRSAHVRLENYVEWKRRPELNEPIGYNDNPPFTMSMDQADALLECCTVAEIHETSSIENYTIYPIVAVDAEKLASKVGLFRVDEKIKILQWAQYHPPVEYDDPAALEALYRANRGHRLDVEVEAKWELSPAQGCRLWYEKVMPVVRDLSRDGRGDDVRVVFGFDN